MLRIGFHFLFLFVELGPPARHDGKARSMPGCFKKIIFVLFGISWTKMEPRKNTQCRAVRLMFHFD